LALIGAVLSLGFLWLYLRLASRASFTEDLGGSDRRPLRELLARPLAGLPALAYLLLLALLVLAPILTVVLYSLQARSGWAASGWSLDWYRRLLAPGGVYLQAIRNSLLFGGLTVAYPAAGHPAGLAGRPPPLPRQRPRRAALMLPWASPRSSWAWAPGLRPCPGSSREVGSRWCSPTRSWLPCGRAVSPVLQATRLLRSAHSLGAGPGSFSSAWSCPCSRALITGAAFAFGISVGVRHLMLSARC
jgi:hypothetical protein